MATNVNTGSHYKFNSGIGELTGDFAWANFAVPTGRFFYTLIFLLSSMNHFKSAGVAYAASQGVPAPQLLVPLSGLMILFGGLSVLLGYRARLGALLLILFLVPVTLMMHNFWTLSDPMMYQIQQAMFMKNLSMLGAALMILYFGSGPVSFDNRT